MRVRYAHLCDFHIDSKEGKPSLIGIFNRVWSRSFPFQMPRPCSIFVCLVVEHEDAGKVIPWRISIRSPESVELMGLDAQMPLPADLMPGDLNFKWEIRSLRFTEAGPHLIEISIDGESEWSLALEVQKRASNG